MTCEKARQNLEFLTLGGLPSALQAEVEAHLASCPECRSEEEELRSAIDGIKADAPDTRPPPEFVDRVSSAVAAELSAERRRDRLRRVCRIVGPVAAVLVLCVAAWHTWSERQTAPGRDPNSLSTGLASERWRYPGASAETASLADATVVQGPSLFFIEARDAGSCVTAVDVETGHLKWRSQTQAAGYLAADESHLFCLATERPGLVRLLALDADDGKLQWSFSQPGRRRLQSPCVPVPIAGDRVSWTEGDRVCVLDASTGKVIWTRTISGEGTLSRAAVAERALYLASGRALRSLSLDSGEERWAVPLERGRPSPARPYLAIDHGRAYLTRPRPGPEARLQCVDLASREVSWDRVVPASGRLLVTEAGIYLRSRRIQAFDGETGEPRWSLPASGCGPLTLIDGLVYFVDSGGAGRLVAVEELTGKRRREIAGIRSCDAFTTVGQTGYIKTLDGTIHALALWRHDRS